MADAEYQIVTVKRALGRHGVVCRMRAEGGSAPGDVSWRPPQVAHRLRPFARAIPLPIRDRPGKGFAPIDGVPISGLFKGGIIAASFASDAAELGGSVLDRHGLARSDRVVAWAPPDGKSGAMVEQRAWEA
jgi:hypothetical protein